MKVFIEVDMNINPNKRAQQEQIKQSRESSSKYKSIKNIFQKININLYNIFQKSSPTIYHLGGVKTPSVDLEGTQKKIYEKGYFYEKVPVKIKDKEGNEIEIHLYGLKLKTLVDEWISTKPETRPGENFQDFVNNKLKTNSELKEELLRSHVRFCNDIDREKTVTTVKDGHLQQVGLDKDNEVPQKLPKGCYAFVLAYTFNETKMGFEPKFYASPKIKTNKGQIQHSSFVRSGNVLSAGKMDVDENGKITSILNSSGHYRPNEKEMAQILNYLKESGYDISNVNVDYAKNKFAFVIKKLFSGNNKDIVKGNVWLEQVGRKYLRDDPKLQAKEAAFALIEKYGWEVNDRNKTIQQMIKKLNDVVKDIEANNKKAMNLDNFKASNDLIARNKEIKVECLEIIKILEGKVSTKGL